MEFKIKFNFGGNEVRQEERDYIEEKIEKLKKFLPEGDDKEVIAEVNIGRDKKGFWELEFLLNNSHEIYRSTERNKDLREAMDRIEEVATKQLRRNKEKKIDLRRNGRRKIKESIVTENDVRI